MTNETVPSPVGQVKHARDDTSVRDWRGLGIRRTSDRIVYCPWCDQPLGELFGELWPGAGPRSEIEHGMISAHVERVHP